MSQFQNNLIPARQARFLYARIPAVSINELKRFLFDFRWKAKPYLTGLSVSIASKMLLKLGYKKLRTCTNLHTKLADDWIFLKHILLSTAFIYILASLWPHFGVFRHIFVSRKKRIGLSNEEGRVLIRETLSQESERESDFWVLSFTKFMLTHSIHGESFFVCV